jgi:hypothetical protein
VAAAVTCKLTVKNRWLGVLSLVCEIGLSSPHAALLQATQLDVTSSQNG